MKESVAALAPVTPPETGASTNAGCATEQPGTGVAPRCSCALATSAATWCSTSHMRSRYVIEICALPTHASATHGCQPLHMLATTCMHYAGNCRHLVLQL